MQIIVVTAIVIVAIHFVDGGEYVTDWTTVESEIFNIHRNGHFGIFGSKKTESSRISLCLAMSKKINQYGQNAQQHGLSSRTVKFVRIQESNIQVPKTLHCQVEGIQEFWLISTGKKCYFYCTAGHDVTQITADQWDGDSGVIGAVQTGVIQCTCKYCP